MKRQVVGISHVATPLALRERASFSPGQIDDAYRALVAGGTAMDMVILSTCNRTELYVSGAWALADILTFWEKWTGIERGQISDGLYWYQDDEAVRHLFRVAAGLDSMIVGEPEILGQVKGAYQRAQQAEVAGSLHRMFQMALKVGKRARTETLVAQNGVSMGHVVVELAQRVFGSLRGRRALVVGAGAMAELVSRHFRASGVEDLVIVNRTHAHGQALAARVGASAPLWSDLRSEMARADIVAVATKSADLVINEMLAKRAFHDDANRIRFLFDLSVPRNIAPGVAHVGRQTFVYDVDDVQAVVAKNQAERMREADAVGHIIEEELKVFKESMGATHVGAVIRSLQERAEAVRRAELTRVMAKLHHLSDEDRALIDQATRLMVNKILNDPVASLRRWAGAGDKHSLATALELFDLEREAEKPTLRNAQSLNSPS